MQNTTTAFRTKTPYIVLESVIIMCAYGFLLVILICVHYSKSLELLISEQPLFLDWDVSSLRYWYEKRSLMPLNGTQTVKSAKRNIICNHCGCSLLSRVHLQILLVFRILVACYSMTEVLFQI